jgi:hypothetical protein
MMQYGYEGGSVKHEGGSENGKQYPTMPVCTTSVASPYPASMSFHIGCDGNRNVASPGTCHGIDTRREGLAGGVSGGDATTMVME